MRGTDEYYVNMMIAWYFATALAKQYVAVLPFIEGLMSFICLFLRMRMVT